MTLTGIPPQQPDDVRGWLTFTEPLPAPLQNAEDSTLENDFASRHRHRIRPATPTECALLSHLGYVVPDGLVTVVDYVTSTVRRRTWPALAKQRTPIDPTRKIEG